MYEYRAKCLRVVDGDTIHVDVDLGVDIHVNLTVRLYGIDTPELSSPEGQSVRAYVSGVLLGKEFTLKTLKDKREKYGRYLGIIILDTGEEFNQRLVDQNMAKQYYGGKR